MSQYISKPVSPAFEESIRFSQSRKLAAEILSKVAEFEKSPDFPFDVTAEDLGRAVSVVAWTAQRGKNPREYLTAVIAGIVHGLDDIESWRCDLLQRAQS